MDAWELVLVVLRRIDPSDGVQHGWGHGGDNIHTCT